MALTDVASRAELQAAVQGGQPAVAHFWAAWCEPCKQMDVVLRQLAAENTHAHFLRVEAEEQPEISEEYSVASVPLFLFFKNGALVDRLEGANAPELAHKVAVHISKPGAAPGSSSGVGATASPAQIINSLQQTLGASSVPNVSGYPLANGSAANGSAAKEGLTPELTKRLEELVVSQPVVLFMKGSADEPRCGFSSKVVAALKDVGVPFGTFDILKDEEVRQGLKVFSDWPTFPQLYASGELVGGCDIILEMHRSGELRKTLEAAAGKAGAGKAQAASAAAGAPGSEDKAALVTRLKSLVASSPTMLFMKGTPQAPQCGFSRKVVDALNGEGVPFGSFDILSDEGVRQGLKELSDWPTYPQLYHKGEFIGGCDIVLELKKNGELKSTLGA